MSKPLLDSADFYQVLSSRQSHGQLVEPAPSAQQLEQAVAAALTAPDHHRLRPWRFITVQGAAREQFGQVLADALQASGETDPVQLDRVRAQPLRAPLILVCATVYLQHDKVPMSEQLLSTGAAIQNLLLMLQAQGFAAMWRTGALTESLVVKHAFGLTERDHLAGFVYIGSPLRELPARQPLSVADFLQPWSGGV